MGKVEYEQRKPVIGDGRFCMKHNYLLDPLRVINWECRRRDPNIQSVEAFNGKASMFETGKFMPASWYRVGGNPPYMIRFSDNMIEDFTGSALITANVKKPFDPEKFTYFDDDYIQQLTEYFKKTIGGDINLVLSDGIFKTLTFGHISLRHNHTYSELMEDATEQLCHDSVYRDIIYVGDDLKEGFSQDDIAKGDEWITIGHDYILNNYRIPTDEPNKTRLITREELDQFHKTAKQKVLKYTNQSK